MIGPAENYFIKSSYVTRTEDKFFDDTPYEDEYQRPVYEFALDLAQRRGYRRVIDVGCGSGFKLIKFFHSFETIGVDLSPTVEWLRSKYPDRCWATTDEFFMYPAPDLVICSDVIEHVPNPNELLSFIERLCPRSIILSTPERDVLKLGTEDGPPRNAHHVREWNYQELNAYVSSRFEVVKHFVAEAACQVIECELRS